MMCEFLSFTITNTDGLKIWYGGDLTSHSDIEREYGVVGFECEWLSDDIESLKIRVGQFTSDHFKSELKRWVYNNFPSRTHLLQYMLQNKKLHNVDLAGRYGRLPLSLSCSGWMDIRNCALPSLKYSEIEVWVNAQSLTSLKEVYDVHIGGWFDMRGTSVRVLDGNFGGWVDASWSKLESISAATSMNKPINITNTPLSNQIGISGWAKLEDIRDRLPQRTLTEEREYGRIGYEQLQDTKK